MAEDRQDQSDEQVKLLKEIRDLLIEQTRLVGENWEESRAQWSESRSQWEEHRIRWDAEINRARQNSIGCYSSIAALALIAVLTLIGQLVSK